MSIIKLTNKKTGVVYVYESFSYWDPQKKQPRNKRKLIGKIDPETGDIVPTGKRGRPSKAAADPQTGEAIPQSEREELQMLRQRVLHLNKELAQKDATIHDLNRKNKTLESTVRRFRELAESVSGTMQNLLHEL
ncbi:hypothetical protein [Allobaculum mucilyticum]|uniref:hypothetical protein n=1 Tax=Allobaculum mucilyticum TaxID=2834459 RepID=UPI001E3E9202|nr:hypothetical protein [Allobaculum mucilyticum]UNT95674.1 hypothetical protein KWG62_10205 [Allobaculum mucilyticum]